MGKKIVVILFTLIACVFMSIPVFAEENQREKDYRIYMQSYGGSVSHTDQGGVNASWGSWLVFALAESDKGSEVTVAEKGLLRDGERPSKGASWTAVLPNGTITEPCGIGVEIDPFHESDDEQERQKWEQEYVTFLIPLEMTGNMKIRASVDGTVVAEYDVMVIDRNAKSGKLIRGWIWSNKNRYYVNEDGTLARGWIKLDGRWYYLDQDGILQTGWKYVSYKGKFDWYYLNTDDEYLGSMRRGWQKIDDIWYYLRKDGTLASNEWYRGYWVSKDGSWKYQPKGSWKKDKNGWWFGDTSGWYAKNQSMKIDGVLYTFDAEGYLVE